MGDRFARARAEPGAEAKLRCSLEVARPGADRGGGVGPRGAAEEVDLVQAQHPRLVLALPAARDDRAAQHVLVRQVHRLPGVGARGQRRPGGAEVLGQPHPGGADQDLPDGHRRRRRAGCGARPRARSRTPTRRSRPGCCPARPGRAGRVDRLPLAGEELVDEHVRRVRAQHHAAAVAVGAVAPHRARRALDRAVVLQAGDHEALEPGVHRQVVRLDHGPAVVHGAETRHLRRVVAAVEPAVAGGPQPGAPVRVREVVDVGVHADADVGAAGEGGCRTRRDGAREDRAVELGGGADGVGRAQPAPADHDALRVRRVDGQRHVVEALGPHGVRHAADQLRGHRRGGHVEPAQRVVVPEVAHQVDRGGRVGRGEPAPAGDVRGEDTGPVDVAVVAEPQASSRPGLHVGPDTLRHTASGGAPQHVGHLALERRERGAGRARVRVGRCGTALPQPVRGGDEERAATGTAGDPVDARALELGAPLELPRVGGDVRRYRSHGAQHPEPAPRAPWQPLGGVRLAGADEDLVEGLGRAPLHHDRAARVPVRHPRGHQTGCRREPAHALPGGAAVAGVPDPAVGGGRVDALAQRVHRDRADPAHHPRAAAGLPAQHRPRPDRQPQVGASARRGRGAAATAPPRRRGCRARLVSRVRVQLAQPGRHVRGAPADVVGVLRAAVARERVSSRRPTPVGGRARVGRDADPALAQLRGRDRAAVRSGWRPGSRRAPGGRGVAPPEVLAAYRTPTPSAAAPAGPGRGRSRPAPARCAATARSRPGPAPPSRARARTCLRGSSPEVRCALPAGCMRIVRVTVWPRCSSSVSASSAGAPRPARRRTGARSA